MPEMRILQIVADLTPANGVAEVVLNLSDALTSSKVTIAAASHIGNEQPRPMKRKEVRVVRFKPCPPHFLCFSWQMMRELGAEAKRADVIHVHGAWSFPVWWGCHLAIKYRKPLIRTPHGSFMQYALAKSAMKKKIAAFFLEKHYLAQASVVHATSQEEVNHLRGYLPAIRSLAYIPNGVELQASDRQSEKSQGKLRTVLFLGRLHPLKGLEMLVEAWGLLRPRSGRNGECKNGGGAGEVWRLVIAGPDEEGTLKALKTQVARLGLEESVVFAGPVYGQEKARLMRAADVFVLPSRSENFGIVVAEALACGVPVITTKGAPWSELLGMGESELSTISRVDATGERGERANTPKLNALSQLNKLPPAANGRCGWWVDVAVAPLAEALREAMSLTDEERYAMGENGRRLVERKYRWEAVAEQMAAVYGDMVNGKS